MQNQKIFQQVSEVETRTMLAERNHGRIRLPLNRVARGEILLRRTLAVLSPADRENSLSLASVIRAECGDDSTARMHREHANGEDLPVDHDDQTARHAYFRDWAANYLAGMPHDEAAAMVQEVRDST